MLVALSSGIKTESSIIIDKSAVCTGCLILTNGTDDVTLTLYDGQNTDGHVIFSGMIPGANNFGNVMFEIPIACPNGLFALLNGTGGKYLVYFNYI